MNLKLIGITLLSILTIANIGFAVFLFVEQGNIYNEVKALEGALSEIGKGLGQTVEQISEQEAVAQERRNSIKVGEANFGENILQVSYKLGSDISSVTKVFQDWGDHSQEPKVADIETERSGNALFFSFTPVVNPEDGTVVVVIQAQSATLGTQIQVETHFDLTNRQVTQGGEYTKEPL